MDFIKNNQLLKVELSYDQDYGQIGFNDFIEDNGLERLSDWEWLKFGNPEAMHFTPEDLKTPTAVYEALEEVALNVTESSMPDLTDEEFSDLFQAVADEDWQAIDLEVARRGLLSMNHVEWYEALNHYNDLRDILAPYTYTARGYSQGDVAHLYLIGMDEEEARRITAGFEQYAYDTPYQFRVELVDCQSGDTIDEDSLGGIYDDADLTCLKEELETSIKNLNGIDGEVMALAFDAIRPLDYTNIKL